MKSQIVDNIVDIFELRTMCNLDKIDRILAPVF